MYNNRPRSPRGRSPSPVRRSAYPSKAPIQSIPQRGPFNPMMFCLFVLIIIIVILTAGVVIIGVFFGNALNNPECERVAPPAASPTSAACPTCPASTQCPAPPACPTSECPTPPACPTSAACPTFPASTPCPTNPACPTSAACPTCPASTPCPTPFNHRLELTPEQVAQHMANFEALKADIVEFEGFYEPSMLHKRAYYTRNILPPLTDEQKAIILDSASGCTDEASFRTEGDLDRVEFGQWMFGVENQPSFGGAGTPAGQGRKKRASSASRACGAYPPATLYTCIVNGGLPASLVTGINGYIQWVFHEDCNGVKGTGCSASGSCCEIVRHFKAWVFLTGDSIALEKDIEVHTCDCAN